MAYIRKSIGRSTTKRATPKAGPYVATARARKTPGKSVRVGGTVVMKKAGKKPLSFKKGALKSQLGVAQSKKIPAKTMKAALTGKKGKLAKKRALFKKNVLTGRK